MSVLADVAQASDGALREHAVAAPAGERYGASDRGWVMEAVREGYEMHYGEPRAFAGMDPDLRLLAGDALYALGLARLADRADVEAVAELADLISLTARAHAEGHAELAESLWLATARALSDERGPGARASWRIPQQNPPL